MKPQPPHGTRPQGAGDHQQEEELRVSVEDGAPSRPALHRVWRGSAGPTRTSWASMCWIVTGCQHGHTGCWVRRTAGCWRQSCGVGC